MPKTTAVSRIQIVLILKAFRYETLLFDAGIVTATESIVHSPNVVELKWPIAAETDANCYARAIFETHTTPWLVSRAAAETLQA